MGFGNLLKEKSRPLKVIRIQIIKMSAKEKFDITNVAMNSCYKDLFEE